MVATVATVATVAGDSDAASKESPAAAEDPSRIGRYRVLGRLGRGGMGEVFLALDEQLERRVAIKLLSGRGDPARFADHLLREALALACLAHPNVVAIHEVGESGGQVYLVMEHVEGVTLRVWLKERPRSRDEILGVLLQAGRGLAAAHKAGLVHRDFKPDNVMIGDDGRVRVLDFGLACAAGGVDPETTSTMPSGRLQLADGATAAGYGTPGYMAPEQYLGIPQDARSDIFSFCVVLFEVLHGRRPFHAEGGFGLRDAILRGQVVPVQRGEVPRWLDAVIRRGLIGDPELRWASVDELLAALSHKPNVLARRALRGVGALALVGAVAAVASLGVIALSQDGAAAHSEQLAQERLAATEAIVRAADADGDAKLAETTFAAFVSDPAHRGTRALTQAWQHRGDQRRAVNAGEEALDAYARAYLAAHEADAGGLMRTMAEMFRERWDGPALTQALATLRARGLSTPADASLALEAALLRGDVAEAARLAVDDPEASTWAPLLATLAHARHGDAPAGRIVALPAGGPAAVVVLAVGGQEAALLDRDLQRVGQVQAAGRELRLVTGAPWIHAFANGQAELLDIAGERTLWRGPQAQPDFLSHALDLDGDGNLEVLHGRAWPALGFHVLTGLGTTTPRDQVAHATTDASDSQLSALWAGDLDGDGTQEIVAALGPWTAFDLRVFHADDRGELSLLARRSFGNVTGLTSLRRGDQRLLVAVNDEHCPDPTLFPVAPHTGEAAGVHLLRWDGEALGDVDFLPLPRNVGAPIVSAGVIAADLDGDTIEELAVELTPPGTTMLVRQGEAGLEQRHIQGLRPLAAAQLDDDPAYELIVRAGHDDSLWILGAGTTPLAGLTPAPAGSRPVPASLTDPLLVERWVRADELAGIGLPAPAAASLREVVGLTSDPDARRDLLEHAADLLARAGDDLGVVELARGSASELGPATQARQAAALARLGRHEEAHAAAQAVLQHPTATPAQRAEAEALRARLEPLVGHASRVEIDFHHALDPAWSFTHPAGLRRDAAEGTLRLTVPADVAPVAELPLAWDGGPLALEFELDIERIEYGACLRLAVLDRNDVTWIGAGVCAIGGGGRLLHIDRCGLGGTSWIEFAEKSVASAVTRRRIVVRVAGFPDGTAECSFDEGSTVKRAQQSGGTPPLPGPLRLAIGALTRDVDPTLAIGTLRSITIYGARSPVPREVDPRASVARRLVEGEPLAALVELDAVFVSEPRDALLRVLAYDDLRDLPGLARAVDELLPHLRDPAWQADLALLLRREPAAAMALQQAAGAGLLPLLASTWATLRTHVHDPEIQRATLAELGGLDVLRPSSAEERHALRRLLNLRADIRASLGHHEHARRDLEAALALPGDADSVDVDERVQGHIQLARLLVALDPLAARAHADAAVAESPRPELVRDRLAAIPGLR